MKYIFLLLFSLVFIGIGFGQEDFGQPDFSEGIGMPEENIEEQQVGPGSSYCNSKFPNDASNCISCLQNGSMYDGNSCIMMEQLCTNAYSLPDDQATCNDKYTQCTNDGWSPDRCACKAIGGVSLNTNVPFVGNCIALRGSSSWNTTVVDPTTAFPVLVAGLTRIVMTIILIFCFMAIIVWGILMSMGGYDPDRYKEGKTLIKRVVMALALLGASGVILRLINPNFFG